MFILTLAIIQSLLGVGSLLLLFGWPAETSIGTMGLCIIGIFCLFYAQAKLYLFGEKKEFGGNYA